MCEWFLQYSSILWKNERVITSTYILFSSQHLYFTCIENCGFCTHADSWRDFDEPRALVGLSISCVKELSFYVFCCCCSWVSAPNKQWRVVHHFPEHNGRASQWRQDPKTQFVMMKISFVARFQFRLWNYERLKYLWSGNFLSRNKNETEAARIYFRISDLKKKKGKRREREFKSEFNAVVCFWHVTHSQSIFYEPVRSNLSVSCVFCASCALRNGKILSTYQVKPGVARYRRENCQTQMQALVFLGH